MGHGTQIQNFVARRRTRRAMPVSYKSARKDPKNSERITHLPPPHHKVNA